MQPAARMLCSWASRQQTAQAKLLVQALTQQTLWGIQGNASCDLCLLAGQNGQQLRHASDDRQRGPSDKFLQQKARAMGLPHPTDAQQDQQTNAITVRPNEGKASIEQVAKVVDHSALIVSRPIEWGTVIFGYEQANRYTVYDHDGQVVAQLAEDYTGIGNEIGRQILRTRRSFTATVFSADGSQVIFRLRRPVYLINSTMYIEDAEGNTVGEIRQRWHPIRRNYDLYLGKTQFAAISGAFLAWEFELKDAGGGTLALIDRNFQGFGKEFFTDAGKYVVHYGFKPEKAAEVANQTIAARTGSTSHPSVTPMALARTEVAVIPSVTGNQLAVVRPLQLEERMIALAAAISIDYDFFSQHSHSSGWFGPPVILPMPLPGGGGGGAPVPGAEAGGAIPPVGPPGTASGAAGAGAAGAASETAGSGLQDSGFQGDSFGAGSGPQQGVPDGEMHLGGDEFTPPPSQGEEFKWDLPEDSGGGGDGEGGAGGILATIWAMITGGD